MPGRVVPCRTCPWRKTTRTCDIPGGGMDHARAATATGELVTDDRGYVVSGLTVMQCHVAEHACAGFVVRVGYDAIGVRLAALTGALRVEDYDDGGADLWPDMAAMLAAHPEGP